MVVPSRMMMMPIIRFSALMMANVLMRVFLVQPRPQTSVGMVPLSGILPAVTILPFYV